MDYINYDLDLRSPESRYKKIFFGPNFLRYVVYAAVLTTVISAFFLADHYRMWLHTDLDRLKSELVAKTEAAKPLINMTGEIEAFNQRAELEKRFQAGYLIKTDHLKQMIAQASEDTNVEHLSINTEGEIEIRGKCKSLQDATLYAGRLKELAFIGAAEISAAELNENGVCIFSIRASIGYGGGETQDE